MGRGAVHIAWMGDDVAILTLDNPQARNAMSIPMMQQLHIHVQEICLKKPIAVILTALGEEAFCAGGDLHDVRAHLMHKEEAQKMNQNMSRILSSFALHNIFVFVALNGLALGGGAELTTYGNMVIAEPHSYIAFVHAKLGVSPGWGGGMGLVQKVGTHRARQILVSAQRILPEQALAWGLIDQIVDKGCALDTAKAQAQKIAQYPKGAVQAVQEFSLHPTAVHESEIFLSLWGEEAHRHALGMTTALSKK